MRLNEIHEVMWCKVKGHSADFPMNERCDRLAAAQKMLHSPETPHGPHCPRWLVRPGRHCAPYPRPAPLPRGSPCPTRALRARLLATPTLPDSAWADLRAPGESRRPGESRTDFIRRARLAAPARPSRTGPLW